MNAGMLQRTVGRFEAGSSVQIETLTQKASLSPIERAGSKAGVRQN